MTDHDCKHAHELGQLSTLPDQIKRLSKTVDDNQAVLRQIAQALSSFASVKTGLDRLGERHDAAQKQYRTDICNIKKQLVELQNRPARQALEFWGKIKLALSISISVAFMWWILGGKP